MSRLDNLFSHVRRLTIGHKLRLRGYLISIMQNENRHQACVAAEARRLERQLRTIGPMPREMLARRAAAGQWREGSFEEAVREGLRAGRLRELPLHWLEATRL